MLRFSGGGGPGATGIGTRRPAGPGAGNLNFKRHGGSDGATSTGASTATQHTTRSLSSLALALGKVFDKTILSSHRDALRPLADTWITSGWYSKWTKEF